MANPRNVQSVEALRGLLAGADTFFLVNYQGLSAGEIGALRTKLREAGGRMLVAKNTLINVVLKERGVSDLADLLQGPTALVLITGDDPVAPAKVLAEFAKGHAKNLPTPKGGRLQGARIDAPALEKIARLPPREQLLSELLGVLQAPLVQLLGVLMGPHRNLVSVLNNYADKLKEEGHGV